MLYTYAIEPEALATWDKCRLILNLMGFQHGRAIAAYPTRKRWKALVRAACRENSKLGDRDRRRILRKLDLSNGKLVSSDAEYDHGLEPTTERWIRNAVDRQTAESAFHAILATRNPTNHPDVVLDEDVDESHGRFVIQREQPVLREPVALVAHVATLVRNSRELLLIDRHFDPSISRWRQIVRACIELAGQSVRDNPSVTIHTLSGEGRTRERQRTPSDNPSVTNDTPSPHQVPTSVEDFRAVCLRRIRDMLTGRIASVRICCWRRRDQTPHDFHARYLLTDRGGYKLDKGLDRERGVEQPVGLLDDREWQRLRQGYGNANPFFEKADAFTLDKVRHPAPGAAPRRVDKPRTVMITPDGWSPSPA